MGKFGRSGRNAVPASLETPAQGYSGLRSRVGVAVEPSSCPGATIDRGGRTVIDARSIGIDYIA